MRNILTELVAVEPYLTSVVVTLTAQQRQHVVLGGETLDNEQPRCHVEADAHGVLLLLGNRHQRRRLGDEGGRLAVRAPVNGVDGHRAMLPARHGTAGVAHRVVADGDAQVVGALGRNDAWVRLVCRDAYGVGGNHPCERLVVHLPHQLQYDVGALAVAYQDEGPPAVVKSQIIAERPSDVAQRERDAGIFQTVALKTLQRALPVVGRIEVQAPAQQRVNADHLSVHRYAQAVLVSVGIVARRAVGEHVVGRFGRSDIKDVGSGQPFGNVPLQLIGIVGQRR